MRRKLVCVLIGLGVLMGTAFPVNAAGAGTILVSPQQGGALVPGGEVTLYRVGEAVDGGYQLSTELADWIVEESEIFDVELAKWMAKNTTEEGISETISDSGTAEFTCLDAGVYLLVQTEAAPGHGAFSPFLVVLPMSGPQWEVTTCPKVDKLTGENPKTGTPPAPLLGAMGMVISGLGLAGCIERKKKKK